MYHAVATVAFVLLLLGWLQRRRRRTHVTLVLGGISIDLAIVVILELQRDVVAMSLRESFGVLQAVHIGASALAVVLYLPTLVLGFRLLRATAEGAARLRHKHARVAVAALLLRAVGFVCMWTV